MEKAQKNSEWFAKAERRIAWLTVGIGLAAGAVVSLLGYPRWGVGTGIGALLAWVNFLWFEQGVNAVARVARAQQGAPKPRISLWIWVKFIARYGLIAVLLYTTWVLWKVPVVSMLAGLCALGAAAIAESIYEIAGFAD